MAPDPHTSLESLLLFQALQSSGTNPPSFGKISETLKTNELLIESDSFAPSRLEPKALKDHYLHLLREEIGYENTSHNGALGSNESEHSMPLLETVEEAFQYRYLVPKLTNRLYFRYRDDAFKAIEAEERQHRAMQKELQEEIEREERDARLHRETTVRRDSRGVSSIQGILRHDDDEVKSQLSVLSRPSSSSVFQNGVGGAHPGEQLPLRNGVRKTSVPAGPQDASVDYKRPISAELSKPFLPPPPQPTNQVYPAGSPSSEMYRRPPPPNQLQSYSAQSSSPRSTQTPLPSAERHSASPIILPPPPGMLHSSSSPTGPLDALADMAGQQYRANPPVPSPRVTHNPASQSSHQLPQPRNYPPRPYPYYDAQPPYQAPYTPYGQPPLPPANYQPQPGMPPYQNPHVTAGQGSHYNNVQQYPPMSHYPPPHPVYNQNPGYFQQPPAHPTYARSQVPRFNEPQTPIPVVSGKQRPPKPSPITTSASSTKWKNVDAPGTVRASSPVRPTDAISPISEKAPSPSPEPSQPHAKMNENNQQQMIDSPSQKVRGKSSRGRGSNRRGRGGRAASVVSSTHAGSAAARTRSQSVMSQADELSVDQLSSTQKIKPEPLTLSAPEDEASNALHNPDDRGRKSNRQRQGTHPGDDKIGSSRPNSKHQRDSPAMLPPSSPAPPASSKPGFVLATRNFPKISAPLMNDITTHKLGNLFAKPLTDREAPGYKDLIYRPQDLRSIRNAINAGGKGLAKIAESMGEEASPSSIWVPESPEVVPPAGIVNSDQLERELMRVFANAIMFNPEVTSKRGFGPAFRTRQKTLDKGVTLDDGDDVSDKEVVKGKQDISVVKDAREMFDAVEKKVAAWRRAERASDEDNQEKGTLARLRGGGSEEADELAGTGDDSVIGTVEQDDTPEPRSRRRKR